jgi:hypothetical protein
MEQWIQRLYAIDAQKSVLGFQKLRFNLERGTHQSDPGQVDMTYLSGAQNIKFAEGHATDFPEGLDLAQKVFQEATECTSKGATVKQPGFEGGIAMVGLIAMMYLFRGIMRRFDFLIYP